MRVIKVVGKHYLTGEGVAQFFDWHEDSHKLTRSSWHSRNSGTFCKTLEDAGAMAIEIAKGKGIVDATALFM